MIYITVKQEGYGMGYPVGALHEFPLEGFRIGCKGQSLAELSEYPELVEVMKDGGLARLPDESLKMAYPSITVHRAGNNGEVKP